ncbi:MAG: ABC transporter substrate-binding protein [Bacteroidota bacterium]
MFSGKRLISLVVLGLLVFSLVAAGTVAAKAKPYEIKWYFNSNGTQKDEALILQEVNKYLLPKINATLKLYNMDFGTYGQKLSVMLASGEPIDLMFMASWTNPSYRDAVAKGYLLDITKLWDKYAPKSKAQRASGFILGTQINGKNYGIPCNKEMAHQWGFMIRRDIAEKYNFDLSTIKKFTDIEPMLKVIKENEPNMIPLQNTVGETGYKFLDFDRIVSDTVPAVLYNDSKDMKIFCELESAEAKAYFATVRKWFLAGYIPADAATMSNFSDPRRAGKVFASCNSLKPGAAAEGEAANGFPLQQIELTKPWVQTRDVAGSMMVIPKTCKDPATVLKFYELFNTDPYLCNLLLYGIEGKHYIKVNNIQIKYPEGLTKQNTPYRMGNNWVFGNQFIQYVYDNEDPNKWDNFKKWNLTASNAKSLGFNFDAEPVKNEVAACGSVWNEFMTPLTVGAVDPEVYLPQAIAKFKAAGLDKIIAEAQKQLDAWLKTKKK